LKSLEGLDMSLNILFAIDIVFNFFTAYQDDDFDVIDDHKVS